MFAPINSLSLDGSGATCPAKVTGAVLMQLCSLWMYGAYIEVQETANKNFNFCAPLKVAPMARAMPVIP